MSKILGIDQSYTRSGIVVLNANDKSVLHAECYSSDPEDDIFKRAWDISNKIIAVANEYKPEMIVIEGLAFGARGSATRDLSGLQFVIISNLRFIHNFNVQIISPRTVKKIASGSGNSEKNDIVNSLPSEVLNYFKSLGFKKTKGLTDLADAYYIALSYYLKNNKTI